MEIYLKMMTIMVFLVVATPLTHAIANFSCRSYCGNLTVDYPFALRSGCGHPGFRDLLFCINDYLMLHLPSGSYRVLDIDYSFRSLTLHDPHLSDCLTLSLGHRANGFSIESWRSPYLSPVPDNAFLLLGCSPRSPLFQGFPTRRLPCRNVSGISCEDYYQCPGWSAIGVSSDAVGTRWGPPECCALPFQAIKEINLSKLECEGYSSAYNLAPLRVEGAHQWSYGIRVRYSVQGSEEFCQACEATGGTCGFTGGDDAVKELCMCDGFNSTSNCDSGTIAFIFMFFQHCLQALTKQMNTLAASSNSHRGTLLPGYALSGKSYFLPERFCPSSRFYRWPRLIFSHLDNPCRVPDLFAAPNGFHRHSRLELNRPLSQLLD